LFLVQYTLGGWVTFNFREADDTIIERVGKIEAIVQRENQDGQLENALKLSRLLFINELEIFKSADRRSRADDRELWMVEEEPLYTVSPNVINTSVVVWLEDQPQPNRFDYRVREILYQNFVTHQWRIRPITQRHLHPSEYVVFPNSLPIQNMRQFKFMLDIYFDDFRTFRTVYHSLGGIYMQLGNMPFELRKRLKNHLIIGLVPFGGKFDDVMRPLLHELRDLERGVVMKIGEEDVWVVAGVGLVTADLPQGNSLADIKQQGASRGCRMCMAPQNRLTDNTYDTIDNARFHHITEQLFEQLQRLINQNASQTEINTFRVQYGLCSKPGILSSLSRDRHLQTPQDAYHAFGGKVQRLIDSTLNMLNDNGKEAFLKYWRNCEKPAHWYRLANPIAHRNSFMFSDALQLAMLLPFILRRFLDQNCFKPLELTNLRNRISPATGNRTVTIPQAIVRLINCWVVVSKATAASSKLQFTRNDYDDFKNLLLEERQCLLEVCELVLVSDRFPSIWQLNYVFPYFATVIVLSW